MAFLPGTVPDESAFTAGASPLTPVGGVWDDALAALTAGQVGELRITEKRAAHVNLRNEAGTEIGTAAAPVRVDPTGTTKQPVLLYDAAGNAITSTASALDVNGHATYSGGSVKPRLIANKTLTVATLSGTGTLIPALVGNYIYIAALQLIISPATTQSTAGDWNVFVFDGSDTVWFNRLNISNTFAAPSYALAVTLEAPAGFFYSSPNINSPITWSVSNTLLTGGIHVFVTYGYTTLLI